MVLHILQGGIDNGDQAWLERAARNGLSRSSWIAPRSAKVGDEAIIYVGSGFFASALITSEATRRPDWGPRRYGAGIRSIKLIEPPISLDIIRAKVPELTWAVYPRSITTVSPAVAKKIKALIATRRRRKGADIEDKLLDIASEDELRARALAEATAKPIKTVRMAAHFPRSTVVHRFVLKRADGVCEGCGNAAPFKTPKMTPYLEPHHTVRLADEGLDRPSTVIALCPTCHRRVHYAQDGEAYNKLLIRKLKTLEPRG